MAQQALPAPDSAEPLRKWSCPRLVGEPGKLSAKWATRSFFFTWPFANRFVTWSIRKAFEIPRERLRTQIFVSFFFSHILDEGISEDTSTAVYVRFSVRLPCTTRLLVYCYRVRYSEAWLPLLVEFTSVGHEKIHIFISHNFNVISCPRARTLKRGFATFPFAVVRPRSRVAFNKV